MKENFVKSLGYVLQHEGGWSDHPQDPGGATMKGVTLAVFRRYYGADRTKDQLRAITDEQLQHIYRTGYWDTLKCDALPAGVDYTVFDAAVNSGPSRAAKWLQRAIGESESDPVDPAEVNLHDAKLTINRFLDIRLAFLRGLGTWDTFGRGWARRVEGVRAGALEMAAAAAVVVPSVAYEVVKKGSKGEWVKRLQGALGIKVDGDFGDRTEAALKQWQTENGLTSDGIAGRMTYRALGLIE